MNAKDALENLRGMASGNLGSVYAHDLITESQLEKKEKYIEEQTSIVRSALLRLDTAERGEGEEMKKMYFVRKGNLYLFKDGYFYEGFKMDPYAVSEEMAIAYKNNGKEEIDIEYVDPDKWPDLYVDTRGQQPMQTQQEKQYFSIVVAPYAIADFIRALYRNGNHEIAVTKEDSNLTVRIPLQENYPSKETPMNCDCLAGMSKK